MDKQQKETQKNLELIAQEAPHLIPELIDTYIIAYGRDHWIKKYDKIHENYHETKN